MMNKSFSLLVFYLSLLGASPSFANQGFSVTAWQSSFSAALEKKDNRKIQQLLRFSELEERVFKKCTDCENKNNLLKARQQFASGQNLSALNLYNKIPKRSDLWLEAVEEKGWLHFRQNDLEKALSQTKTLLSPQFVGIINSEAYLLQSLSQLKLCDYEGVLTTHQLFKENQRARILQIQALAKTGDNQVIQNLIAGSNTFPLKAENFTEYLKNMPLQFYRDLDFQKSLLRLQVSQAGLAALEKHPDSNYDFQLRKSKADSLSKLKKRIQVLAQEEMKENSAVITRLNLSEVEAIQRIHTDLKLSEKIYGQETKFKKVTDNQLIFMDDGQPWIDELDKYEVVANSCARNIRRKM